MFKNYLKIAFRNLIRNKVFSIINISGLTIGIACTIVILLWVQNELSYDNFNINKENLYRANYEWDFSPGFSATSPGMLAPESKKAIPEIIETVRLMKEPKMVVKAIGEDRKKLSAFYEENYYLVDSSLFTMFTLPFINGDPATALDNGMVVTEKTALKYFGTTEVLGKRLNVNGWFDITISGVIKNIPENSHLNCDMFSRLEDLKRFFPNGFTWNNPIQQTYLQLAPGSSAELVAEKLIRLNKENSEFAKNHLLKIYLQPLEDIYLETGVSNATVKQGNKSYVYIFSAIAFIILLIACINFVNLSTAHATSRARSIGMLKIIGASRGSIVKQIWGESIFLAFLSTIFAVMIVELVLPGFNNFTGKKLVLGLGNQTHLLGLLAITLLTGLVAGAFPAIYFSNFKPLLAFSDKWLVSHSGGLRKSLVIAQFFSAVFLIIVTLIISDQLDFMKNQKLGFNKENVICLPVKANVGKQYLTFRNELLQLGNIKGVTIKNSQLTETVNYTSPKWEGMDTREEVFFEIAETDYNFLNTLNLKIVDGRNFSEWYSTDISDAFIVNEAAVKVMKLKNPVGTHLKAGDKDGHIIGVIKDAYFKTLRQPIQPIIFQLTDNFDDVMNLFGVIYISVKPANISETIESIKALWTKFNPDYPFEYSFLDDTYNNLYKSEQKLADIFRIFTFLAIFVTILGLFGLATFMTEQRIKEIGIRKVLGASVIKIIILLSGSFTKWLIIANVIAWPAAWFTMKYWLQSYAYHTEISWLTFLAAGTITLLVTIITVSLIAAKAAYANPVECLHYE